MGLASDCQGLFSASDRRKGQDYFRAGLVRDIEFEGCVAYATVHGSDEYEVTIDWSDPSLACLGVDCTCPRFFEVGVCKHLWAVILELDRRGISSPGRFTEGIHELTDLQEDEDFFFDEEWVPRTKTPKQAKKKENPQTAWKRELAALIPNGSSSNLHELSKALPGGRQILYAIDLTTSQTVGQLVLQLLQRERKRNGDFGKPTRLTLSPNLIQDYRNTADQAALEWLLATAQRPSNYAYYSPYQMGSEFTLPTVALDKILSCLSATGRLYWGIHPVPPLQLAALHAITWDDHTRWRLAIDILADDAQQQWKLQGRLVHAGDPMGLPITQAVFATGQGVVLWPDRLARLEAAGQGDWIAMLRRTESLSIPYADRATFLQQLLALPHPPEIHWPANLQVPRIAATPRGHIAVRTPKRPARTEPNLNATVSFVYDKLQVRWKDPRDLLYCAEPECIVVRDRQQEQSLLDALNQFPLQSVSRYSQNDYDGEFPARQLSELVACLPTETWTIEAEGHALRQPGEFHLNVTSGIDWFELGGEIQFDDQTVALPELLAAIRRGERFIRLGDGSQGILPEDWLQRYGVIADFAQVKDGKVRFKPSQTLLFDALLAEQRHLTVDRKFSDYRQKVQNFAGVTPAEPPRGFTGALRPYQQAGLGWLRFLQDFQFGGCLADDMGLGKTVQVLALLEQRRARRLRKGEERLPSLVVVPRSLLFNWQAEAARFAPKLRVLNFSQPNRQGIWDQLAQHDLVLTTYGTLLRDIIKLKDQRFDYAILDEAQAIKNANSQSAKAARLLQAEHRLALTGTPIENNIGELWSLVEFLNPGMLGKFSSFNALTHGSLQAASDPAHGHSLVAKMIQPILLRRTKQQVLPDLPEKTEQTLYCDLSAAERKKYNELREYYRASLTQQIDQVGLERSKIQVLEALLRLRQSACHQGLLDAAQKGQTSAKLEVLLEHLEELVSEGHKALVFSQFTQLLAIVQRKLSDRRIVFEYLDGKTRDRQKRVERYQNDPACPVFLISLKAGGRGLNLTAADYVFILDPWWNPAVEAQAVDRAHRIGQQNKVFAYRLIARDTVEEKILELQQSKRELADSIISADTSVLKNLTADDLRLLLG